MLRLLLVDDDAFLIRALMKLFETEGYLCKGAITAGEAVRALAQAPSDPFDAVILDVGLPDLDGFALCRRIRSQHRMPVILLSARADPMDKVAGLEVGADDYVTKPFDPRELLARVRAQVRRNTEYQTTVSEGNHLRFGRLLLDVDGRELLRAGESVPLTDREFELLHLLACHAGKVLASDWILERVWGEGVDADSKTLAVHVSRLRRKIEDEPLNPQLLLTVRGFGYKLCST